MAEQRDDQRDSRPMGGAVRVVSLLGSRFTDYKPQFHEGIAAMGEQGNSTAARP
jgi:hypothetical protein